MGYIVCGAKATELRSFNPIELSKAVLRLGRLRLSCSEEQLQALVELLTHSLVFGLMSSWGTDVFIEIGVLAVGIPDMAMSALVKEQIEGIAPLAISMMAPKKFAVVFSQEKIAMFSYEQAVAVTDNQRSVLSDLQKTALAMVLTPWDDKLVDFRDADNFEPEEPIKKAAALDKWEGEDEDEDVKDNWDDDEEDEEKKTDVKKPEPKVSEKKKLSEKIKEKENRMKKKQQEAVEQQEEDELTLEEQLAEKLRVKKLQEDADLELAKDAFGVGSTSNSVTGIDAMCPSSKEDFTEFEKMLKEKITQFEKSVHYSSFLESLFRELCISLEVEDLKKISNSLSVLLSEKQKQEKQNKGKKKKKGVLAGGGLKAQLKDDLDYAAFDGGYAQDYEDFM
uniref:Eukaryotic translation initiation factor 3 subunit J n=1 Tax=Astatotilapia calliptera TaxID=8154 RepID=A0AAX7T6L5_ASTCA